MSIPSGNSGALVDDVLLRAIARAFGAGPSPLEAPRLPERVGPYRIVRRLGRGGMSVVYEAEESNPRRSVALKVLAAGFDDSRAQRRFENECQVLARLWHPAIAQVYAAGSMPSPTGVPVPYFAMELVRGAAPLTRFAEERSLSVRQRIEVFLEVLDGIRHGHERGVVHRDLKPANILVDEAGRPKVIDFGVSRAIDDGQALSPIRTRSGELLGTPHYMSPEQSFAGRAAIDERADVYSLGVVLFELLAGRLPYDLDGLGVLAVAQCVREQPALRLGAVDPRLRGDLETIVGKALEKRPERRYPSAAAMAADLRRYLASEPIAARPPSAAYQLRMFARRNRALVAGALGVLMVSLAGTAVSSVYALRAEERSRDLARENYTQGLTVARSAIDASDFETAREQLLEIDPERRDWEWRVLTRQAARGELTLEVPGDPAQFPTCGFSEGGRTLLAWRDRGETVHAFDARTGEARPALQVDGELVHGTSDPETSRFFAMHSGVVVAWDTLRRDRVWSAEVEAGNGWLELAPSGDRLAVIVKGALEILWLDPYSGRRMDATPVPAGLRHRSSARVDPRGRWVWVAGALGTRFLDPETGARLLDVPTSVSVSVDRDTGELWELQQIPRRARGSGVRPLVRRDPDTLRETLRIEPDGARGGPSILAASPRGGLFACGYEDGSILTHDAATGSVVTELDVMNEVTWMCWSPDGRTLIAVDRSGALRLWKDVAVPRPFEFAVDGRPADGAVDAAGRRVLCNGWERASLWDVDSGELLWSVPRPHSVRAASLRGELLVHADKALGLVLLDATNGSERWRRDVGLPTTATAISSDSRRMFSVHPDGFLRAWDAATGEPLFEGEHGPGGVVHVRVSEHGDRVASAGSDGVVVWNGRTGEVVQRMTMLGCNRVAWAPGGERVAASNGSRVDVWEPDTGRLVAMLDAGGAAPCSDLAFHPDGSRCVAIDTSGWVQVWDTGTSEPVVRLRSRPSSSMQSSHILAFKGDETLVVLGSGTVSLLEARPVAPDLSDRRDELARARLLIDSLTHEGPLVADVVEAFESSRRAVRATRVIAAQQVRSLGQSARELNEAAWLACRSRDGTPEQFGRAVELAEAACEEQPERAMFLSTLGLARYRSRDYEGALDALRRAEAIDGAPEHPGRSASGPGLSDLACIAASLHMLGRADEAQATLSRVRAHATYPDAGDDLDTRHFLREVEATLATPVPTDRHRPSSGR